MLFEGGEVGRFRRAVLVSHAADCSKTPGAPLKDQLARPARLSFAT
jgi:hypothetical protein